MSRIIWTPGAASGLERACLFLAEKDEDAAVKALDVIGNGSKILEDFPNAGRPAEDLEPEHRELLIPFGGSGYVLLYRVENSLVYILALRHQREAGY
ncbi:MAG: type II toxin-antitoxin system RelE/ParE family toxin [Deltaproteobacteria bacterium]|jgi:toxin ParE1/3/4|nr:type II toxin-antitoxin system RelE/ParE family toxin [Deltaproteobacteria bacterium]